MPFDPTLPLKVRSPEYHSPLDSYARFLTLREMMDRRQFADQQRQWQLEDRTRMQSLRDLLAGNPNASWGQIAALDVGTANTIAKHQAEMAEKQRTAANAGLDMRKKAADLVAEQKKTALNELAGIMAIPDPELKGQQFMEWQGRYKTPGVAWPADEKGLQFQYTQAFGPDAWNKRQAELAKAAQEQALYPFQTRKTIAETAKAEGEATGTTPIDTHQRAQLEQNRWGSREGLISVLYDPKSSEADKRRANDGLLKYAELSKAAAPTTIISPNQTIANEAKLRDDYVRDTKTYPIIRDAYTKILGASQSNTGPGDISLLYGYMRMLDPGSTVREGEFATAQNAGGVPERIRAMFNKLLTGERLDEKTKGQFVAEAKKIYDQSLADTRKTSDIYTGIAKRSGMDPRNVVIDFEPAKPAGQTPATHVYDPATGTVRPK